MGVRRSTHSHLEVCVCVKDNPQSDRVQSEKEDVLCNYSNVKKKKHQRTVTCSCATNSDVLCNYSNVQGNKKISRCIWKVANAQAVK